MSLHNELKKNGDILGAYPDILGEDATDVQVLRLGETLTPILDIYRNPEWATLRNEVLWSDFASNNAVVGEFSMFAIGLPTTSTLLLVVEVASARGTGFVQMVQTTRALTAATLTVSAGPKGRDFRATQLDINKRVPGVEEWSGSDPAAFGGIQEEQGVSAAGYTNFVTLPFIIKPGQVLLWQDNTANAAFQIQIAGRVRYSQITER